MGSGDLETEDEEGREETPDLPPATSNLAMTKVLAVAKLLVVRGVPWFLLRAKLLAAVGSGCLDETEERDEDKEDEKRERDG